ncbi:uncharacterized protein LOC110985938 isoform X3 [Acanthaster planci]|uniref:Uncharacterized protein LOC110985938 isoform X3 n=1 Tax=Acanthaster planci TaxID=133434 RepID=A0A8B7ZIL3_ACAPL|nr:uncharacterized protein LOC110985938 isoform X3 [Acanthaster planci]
MERGRVHPVDLSVEAPLPAYDGGPGGAPPSYQSIVEKIHEANETSSTPVHFLYRVTKILLNTAAVTAVLFLLLAVPVAMIVMGALYKDDCPVEPNIPIYLIVTASFSILKCLVDMILRCIKLHQEGDSNEQKSTTEKIFSFVILCFLSVFFIVGNVWVYSNYPPSDIVAIWKSKQPIVSSSR